MRRTPSTVKSATIPSLRVAPSLRSAAQRVLEPGETLSSFIETALRETIGRREAHEAFVARGLASLARAKKTGRTFTTRQVTARLKKNLGA